MSLPLFVKMAAVAVLIFEIYGVFQYLKTAWYEIFCTHDSVCYLIC